MDRQAAPVSSPSRAAAEREAKRRPVSYTYMNLWPFVGVLLALLIAFMEGFGPVLLIFLWTFQAASLELRSRRLCAKMQWKSPLPETDGIFPQHKGFAKALPILIRGAVQEGGERKVYLAVDSRAKYGDATAVVNEIAEAGIREICI